jgi:hypothetical protein
MKYVLPTLFGLWTLLAAALLFVMVLGAVLS